MGHDGTEGLEIPELPWPVRGGQTTMFLMTVVIMAPTTLRHFSLVDPWRPDTDAPTLRHIAYMTLSPCALEGVARTVAAAAFAPSLPGAPQAVLQALAWASLAAVLATLVAAYVPSGEKHEVGPITALVCAAIGIAASLCWGALAVWGAGMLGCDALLGAVRAALFLG